MYFNYLEKADPDITAAMKREINRQETKIEMIASENFVNYEVMEAMGSALTNKYAEGYPGKRYYGGCEFVDEVEQMAIDRAKKIFGAEHANVQAHSGANANTAVYQAVLEYGDTVLDELPQDQVHDWCGYKHHTDVESYGIENQYSY